MMDVTATGLIQNGMLCSGCMVPSGATADRAGSAIASRLRCARRSGAPAPAIHPGGAELRRWIRAQICATWSRPALPRTARNQRSLVACGVLGALVPPRRPFILGVLSFVAGFVLNELPFIAAAWLVVSTLLALDQTGLGSPVGVAAVAVAILAMAGLLLVVRRALLTGPALERALTLGLGAGWRASAGHARTRRRIMSGRVLLAPFLMRRPDVTRIANLSYGDAGRKNLLDVYHGRPGTAKKPVLIHLHGGALYMGRKNRESLPLLYRLASQGWVCISANYRLRPAVTFPDHLIDVKKVIAWARKHARDYGADSSYKHI